MIDPVNHDELVQLVQNSAFDQLTPQQVEDLRQRLLSDADLNQVLRQSLEQQPEWEPRLAELGIRAATPDSQLAKDRPANGTKSRRVWIVGLAAIAVALLVLGFMRLRPQPARPQLAQDGSPPDRQTANNDDDPSQAAAKAPGSDERTETAPSADPASESAVSDAQAASQAETSAQPPMPVNPTAANAEPPPWAAALSPDNAPRAVSDMLYQRDQKGVRIEEFRRWLSVVADHKLQLNRWHIQKAECGSFVGLAKLAAPWPDDAVWRLGMFEPRALQIHFWSGLQGISLRYIEQCRQWAAYRCTRTAGSPVPNTWSLVATDRGRHDRLHLGVFEVRHQAGRLILSRGLIRLLDAPLAEPPREVYLEGAARFSTFAMYRCDPVAWPNFREHRIVHDLRQPAHAVWRSWTPTVPNAESGQRVLHAAGQAPWQAALNEQVRCGSTPDGCVTLSAQKSAELAAIASPLNSPSLLEVVELRVDHAEPGTGIYVGDDNGQPLHRIGFFRDRTTGRTVLKYAPLPETAWETTVNTTSHPPAYVSGPIWLRLVLGLGGLKLAISDDGLRWSPAWKTPERGAQGGFHSVGLYLLKSDRPRRVTLGQVTVRALSGIVGLADQELRDRVDVSDAMLSGAPAAWLDEVSSRCPADVQPAEWRRAAAIRSLNRDLPRPLSEYLLRRLLGDSETCCVDPIARRRFLDDLCLVSDVWEAAAGQRMYAEYERFCGEFWRRGQADDFSRATDVLLTAPLWCSQPLPAPFVKQRIQPEILNRVFARRWQDVYDLSQQIRFWVRSANPANMWQKRSTDYRTLVEWAELISARAVPGIDPDPILDRNREWRNPYDKRVSKEGYNVMAEFAAALAGGALDDACAIIASAGQVGVLGLLPSAEDRELFVSLPKAVAVAVRDNPELKQTMVQKIGPVGVLRVRQAIARSDHAAVQAATIQYYATQAASEAHGWLGDRALSSGRFEQAITQYQAALKDAARSRVRDIAPRLKLALAMLGRPGPELDDGPVILGQREYSAAEFGTLTSQLIAAHRTSSQVATLQEAQTQTVGPVPVPGGFRVEVRGRFDGSVGRSPGNAAFQHQDWPGRQLAVVSDDQRLYVSNRFQLTAYNLADGRKSWSVQLGGEQGEAHHWPSVAARPLIVGDRLLVRRFLNVGPELVSLETQTGKIVWRARPEKYVASDPVWMRQRVFVLTTAVPESKTVQLDLTCLHPETGAVISRKPVIRLRDVWQQRPTCSLQRIADHLLCFAGNAMLCCDAMGQVEWARRSPFVPRSFQERPDFQDVVDPLFDRESGQMFVSQPGVSAVSCLDPVSGRELWSRACLDVKRIMGLSGQVVVVQTSGGLQALDRASGELQWRYHAPDVLLGAMCDADRILICRRIAGVGSASQTCLVWLEPDHGREQAHCLLEALNDPTPFLGPLTIAGSRLWALYGRSWKDGTRDLIELVPDAKRAGGGVLSPSEFADWSPSSDNRTRLAAARTVSGWTPVVQSSKTEQPSACTVLPEFAGERDVLVTRAVVGNPVRLLKFVDIPAEAKPRLTLRVGYRAGPAWQLVVRVSGREVLRQVVDDKSATGGWLDKQLDLAEYGGQRICLSVWQTSMDSKQPSEAIWKTLQCSF